MREDAENRRAVTPDFITIAEIYPGIEDSAVRVGADVYEMYRVVDVIAHEYSAGGYKSADRQPADWFAFMTGMYAFRAFAEGKASWMLTYSWENHEKIKASDAMENLMMSQLMAGANCWDAATHVMSRSNDYAARKRIFQWIEAHETTFYRPRKPLKPVGIYFSPKTRNYFVDEYIPAFRGMMFLLLQTHTEFQIVTPRTRADFAGDALILPDVKCLDDAEIAWLKDYINAGKGLLASGDVVIEGSTFSTLSSDVSVSFSGNAGAGVPANIVETSDTSIEVEVPVGAEDGPIAIEVFGQMINTPRPFTVSSTIA